MEQPETGYPSGIGRTLSPAEGGIYYLRTTTTNMLSLFRNATVKTSRFSPRSLSTASDTVRDVFNAVGNGADGSTGTTTTPSSYATTSSLLPRASSSGTTTTTIINIPLAEDPLLSYLTSRILQNGHRQKAARITSRTLLHLHTFTRAPPLPILREAIFAASPAVRCLSKKMGTKNQLRPIALNEKQRTRYAVKWILEASKSRQGQTMEERLAREMIGILQGESAALEKKKAMHKEAMVNRGNARLW